MKKALLIIGIILVTLTIMAPDTSKAEKLKIDNQDWDRDPAQFIVKLSCQFGAATAGEHADFKVGATMTVKAGEKTYDLAGERGIQKVDGAVKDADNFIAIEPLRIDWIEGKDFEGIAFVTFSVSLVGPSGNSVGTTTETHTIFILGPASVRFDDNEWDSERSELVLSMSAKESTIAFGDKFGWCVSAVDLWVNDKQVDGNHWNSECRPIKKVPGAEPDKDGYIAIEPLRIFWNHDGYGQSRS